uniref:Ubiquitin carboxyl-terminal hydrolase n=1 Tax=Trypanosoma congolense (strain IL3000) TaxID=1068625 RepID=F9WA36_TRYCI|nr:unnamed protein product [Trypanosoma congolense IL3000]
MLCADRWVSELPSEECVSETQSLSCSNTQVLEQLPSDAVLSAYRVHTPCCIKHSSAQTRSMNCVASPTCLAGIKILLSEKITFDDIVASTLGKGPSVMPASQQQREKHDVCSATEGSTSSGVTPADLWGSPLRRGIRSFGNTCYLNAVMQMLFHISSVRDMVLKACVPPPEAGGRAKEVSAISSSGLGELFAEMAYSRTGEGADAQRFASFLSINSGMQQDAQEFFALLVDWLQREVGEDVRKVFEGTLLYHRRCSNCGRSVKREEPFSFLSLPVGCSLENVLETFLRAHEVDEFRCDGCGITSKASSHQYLRTLPDVLIVHFNRFTFNRYTHQREKITRSVGFPVEWDLTSYMERHQQNEGETVEGGSMPDCSSTPSTSPSENLYRLMGLVNHHGDSATCGHYTYHGRMDSHVVGGWCSFDNEEVKILRRFNCSRSASKEVYMLVYERCTKRASSRLSSNVPNSMLEPQNLQIHLPPHLEKHVRRLNHEVETARQAWELRRSAMLCFLREWEIVADAVFCPCAPRRGRARGSVNKSYDLEDYVAFPTRWLELLGSCFMLLSTGAKQCSNVTERKERLSRSHSGRRTTVPNKLPESCDGEHEDGVLLSSAGVLSCMTAEEKASMEGDHFLINSILRKASADFTGCMRCPHGKLAPWGEYKLLPVSAAQRINSFLSSIPTLFAPLTTAGVFAPFTGWNLLSHACSSCVTVMSLKVSLLAKLYNRDKWAHDIISSAVSGGATHPAGTEGEKEEQVYISDIAVEHFENITKTYSESQDIINQQGFTGFLAFIKWGEKDGRAGADALPSSPEILCEHGVLTSGAAVRVVPISVWRFLRERFLHSFIVKWDGSELEPPASVAAQVGKLLPYISAKRIEICSECTGVHISTASAQHNERMEKINEAKQLPTVVAAGRTLSRPLADVQASHPNSSACRRNT